MTDNISEYIEIPTQYVYKIVLDVWIVDVESLCCVMNMTIEISIIQKGVEWVLVIVRLMISCVLPKVSLLLLMRVQLTLTGEGSIADVASQGFI